MLDSLFLETFSIPLLISLFIIFQNYLKFIKKYEYKVILICIVTALFLITFDRLNKLSSNVRNILLIGHFVLSYLFIMIYMFMYNNHIKKYVIILMILFFIPLVIETSLTNDKNILLILAFIVLLYSVYKEYSFHILNLIIFFILVLLIDSPINEITV